MTDDVEGLVEALKPFAGFAAVFDRQRNPAPNNDDDLFYSINTIATGELELFVRDFRRAKAALEALSRDSAEPVQDTWFTDTALPVMAMSGDAEDPRVLKLHFRRPVTDEDRKDMTDAMNALLRDRAGEQKVDEAQTYYAKGKDAAWFENLSDLDFARELSAAAQDLNDTGLGDDLDKWMPHQVMIADASNRIARLASPAPDDVRRMALDTKENRSAIFTRWLLAFRLQRYE